MSIFLFLIALATHPIDKWHMSSAKQNNYYTRFGCIIINDHNVNDRRDVCNTKK